MVWHRDTEYNLSNTINHNLITYRGVINMHKPSISIYIYTHIYIHTYIHIYIYIDMDPYGYVALQTHEPSVGHSTSHMSAERLGNVEMERCLRKHLVWFCRG